MAFLFPNIQSRPKPLPAPYDHDARFPRRPEPERIEGKRIFSTSHDRSRSFLRPSWQRIVVSCVWTSISLACMIFGIITSDLVVGFEGAILFALIGMLLTTWELMLVAELCRRGWISILQIWPSRSREIARKDETVTLERTWRSPHWQQDHIAVLCLLASIVALFLILARENLSYAGEFVVALLGAIALVGLLAVAGGTVAAMIWALAWPIERFVIPAIRRSRFCYAIRSSSIFLSKLLLLLVAFALVRSMGWKGLVTVVLIYLLLRR